MSWKVVASSVLIPVSGSLQTGKLAASPHCSSSSLMWRAVHEAFQLPCFQSRVVVEVHSGIALSLTSTPGRRGCLEPSAPKASDRKSTRLNSSHLVISYAVFCLKKKTLQ